MVELGFITRSVWLRGLGSSPLLDSEFELREREGFAYLGSRLSGVPNTTWRSRMTLLREKKKKGLVVERNSSSSSSASVRSGPA